MGDLTRKPANQGLLGDQEEIQGREVLKIALIVGNLGISHVIAGVLLGDFRGHGLALWSK